MVQHFADADFGPSAGWNGCVHLAARCGIASTLVVRWRSHLLHKKSVVRSVNV